MHIQGCEHIQEVQNTEQIGPSGFRLVGLAPHDVRSASHPRTVDDSPGIKGGRVLQQSRSVLQSGVRAADVHSGVTQDFQKGGTEVASGAVE